MEHALKNVVPQLLPAYQISETPTEKHPKPIETNAIRAASSSSKTKMETLKRGNSGLKKLFDTK